MIRPTEAEACSMGRIRLYSLRKRNSGRRVETVAGGF